MANLRRSPRGRFAPELLKVVDHGAGTEPEEMAASVSALLSPHYTVTTTVGDPVTRLPPLQGDELLLVAPRMWDRLPAAVRQDKRVLDVRHVIIQEELHRVRESLVRAGETARDHRHTLPVAVRDPGAAADLESTDRRNQECRSRSKYPGTCGCCRCASAVQVVQPRLDAQRTR